MNMVKSLTYALLCGLIWAAFSYIMWSNVSELMMLFDNDNFFLIVWFGAPPVVAGLLEYLS
jgi:hypothetical protein